LDEYGKFDTAILAEKTIGITKRMGGDRVKVSIDALNAGDMVGWVMPLLDYYDRNYQHSVQERKGKTICTIESTSEGVEEIANQLLLLLPKDND
jgi:tRNA 2-selenouridine synthase